MFLAVNKPFGTAYGSRTTKPIFAGKTGTAVKYKSNAKYLGSKSQKSLKSFFIKLYSLIKNILDLNLNFIYYP